MLRLDWNILFTVINLILLFIAMRVFLFKPVRKIIAARQEEADKQFAEAAASKEEAEKLKHSIPSLLQMLRRKRPRPYKQQERMRIKNIRESSAMQSL